VDEALARGERAGPLAGLPTLVKDNMDIAGMRTTYGSRAFAGAAPAAADGATPARLRAAGAIVVGKTNLPEFATEGYTSNPLFGTTRNPWNPERSCGGSSGGSAVALAAGMAAVATATDGGGSIRIPAAYCGLVGLKPTAGVVARDPIPDWMDYSTDGPFGVCVDDLRLQLEVVRGPAYGDPSALPSWVGSAPHAAPGRLFATERFTDHGPLPAEVQTLLAGAVARFAEVCASDVTWLDPSSLLPDGRIDDDWFLICPAEHAHRLGRDWIEAHAGELAPATNEFLGWGLAVTLEDYLAARRRRFAYVRSLDDVLGEDGLLLSPVMAVDACAADGGGAATEGDWYCTAAQNVTGHPALSLPAGFHASGVPFGLQVTGPRFREDLLLEVAIRWEEAVPWPRTAPPHDPFVAVAGG
jgi:amidase/aspartyl-tRNA(Asn)/glutamyl-tRNA(Gln) amidotransferase subunit A